MLISIGNESPIEKFGAKYGNQASKEDHELSSELFDKLPQWLEQGKVQPNKPKVLHGLDSVPQGFKTSRNTEMASSRPIRLCTSCEGKRSHIERSKARGCPSIKTINDPAFQ
jgi:hypothetical protein